MAEAVALVAHRIDRLLQRRGVLATAEESGAADRWAEEAPVLAGLAAASVQGLLALGPRAGARIARYGSPPEKVIAATLGPCHANLDGLDLHAGIVARAGQRARLERLCCYTLRPPIAQTRLRVDAEGQVWIALRHQWSDGTTHLCLDPVALLERLAALIPRPRINLVLYYGLLAPRARWRSAVVASAGSEWSEAAAAACPVSDDDRHASAGRGHRGYVWAELMRRTFGIDVLDCPRCGGRLRLLALIEHARIVERILRHLGLPTDRPEPRPARAPPRRLDDPASPVWVPADANS